jgi:hypothetical protein
VVIYLYVSAGVLCCWITIFHFRFSSLLIEVRNKTVAEQTCLRLCAPSFKYTIRGTRLFTMVPHKEYLSIEFSLIKTNEELDKLMKHKNIVTILKPKD